MYSSRTINWLHWICVYRSTWRILLSRRSAWIAINCMKDCNFLVIFDRLPCVWRQGAVCIKCVSRVWRVHGVLSWYLSRNPYQEKSKNGGTSPWRFGVWLKGFPRAQGTAFCYSNSIHLSYIVECRQRKTCKWRDIFYVIRAFASVCIAYLIKWGFLAHKFEL